MRGQERRRLSGRGLEDELRRQQEEELKKEREKRIEHTKEMAIRRIFKRELTRGWQCWYDEYWNTVRQKRLLESAGNRITRPRLVACVSSWRKSWSRSGRAEDKLEVERKLLAQTKDAKALQMELEAVSRSSMTVPRRRRRAR